MTLEQCISEIIKSFKPGDYFDSHTIINALFENPNYHLAYLKKYSQNSTVAQYHGQIAQIIGTNSDIKPIGNAKSHTIYRDLSDNMLWQKM